VTSQILYSLAFICSVHTPGALSDDRGHAVLNNCPQWNREEQTVMNKYVYSLDGCISAASQFPKLHGGPIPACASEDGNQIDWLDGVDFRAYHEILY